MSHNGIKIGAILLIVLLSVGCVGMIVAQSFKKTPETVVLQNIVEVTELNGAFTAEQLQALNNGASIKFYNEVYLLSQIGDERIYTYNDTENLFLRKYIGVNTSDGLYHSWEKVSNDLVTQALLNNALADYTTNSDVNNSLSNALANYLSSEEVKSTLSSVLVNYVNNADLNTLLANYATDEAVQTALNTALANYMQTTDVQKLLSNTLSLYVKQTDGKGAVQQYFLSPGEALNYEKNTMYIIYCFDSSHNLQEFELVGGTKSGNTGKFAFALYGEDPGYSLTIFQTGSIVVSNLVKTSGGTLGIKPSNSSNYLVYFKIGGKTF